MGSELGAATRWRKNGPTRERVRMRGSFGPATRSRRSSSRAIRTRIVCSARASRRPIRVAHLFENSAPPGSRSSGHRSCSCAAGKDSSPSCSAARATASASIGSDLPRRRALLRVLAVRCVGIRSTRSPRSIRNRSNEPDTCRQSSSAHTRSPLSPRARRERYVGEWLPEPIVTEGLDDPARHAETADSLSLAMLVLLESLSPEQRAVLLLHDMFGYGYPEIAAIVGKSEDNARQLATRARRHVAQRRPRFQTTREQRDELARRFFAAAEQGDLAGLKTLLAHDVELTGDGGGKVPALARSLRGRNRVARTLINWIRLAARLPGASLRPVEVNGGPGALFLDGQQRLISVLALDIAGGQITSISSVVNPDKLTHLGPVADFRSLLRFAR